jgi:putative transposase
MPRHARLRLADTPFHVIQRGNNRSTCFFSDQDRRYYLHELKRTADANGVAVHAYVLMTNHSHLLMTPRDPDGISRVMHSLGQRYVQYVNRTYDRMGTLWAGRYRSCLVDAESYLLTCHRYIEANPVRAGMVAHPADYCWSSYRANAEGEPDALLSLHPVVAALGQIPEERRAAYRRLFDTDLNTELVDQIRLATGGGFALGGRGFEEKLRQALQRRVIRGRAGRPHKKTAPHKAR